MRVVIVSVGSRGDVQPCVALGSALRAAGFSVRLAAPASLTYLAADHGLTVTALPLDPVGMLAGDVGRAWVESGRDVRAFLRGLRDLGDEVGERLADAVLDACSGAEAVVYTTLAYPAWHVARAWGLPAIQIGFAPLLPTAGFAPTMFPAPFRRRDPWRRTPLAAVERGYHRAAHHVLAQMVWLPLRRRINAWRARRLGLQPLGWRSPMLEVDRSGEPLLLAYSPTVVPPPPDWGPHVVTTGYWFLDTPDDQRLPDAVTTFLDSGPAPVSVGMGSMTGSDPARLTQIAVKALRRTGQRGLLLSGWAGLGAAVREAAPGSDVLVADEVPHELLFGRVAAAVHHGGAGTTGASLRAGVPTVVVPHFGDQPFWGDRVHALGAGPAPIARRDLDVPRLAHALSAAAHDTTIRRRAAQVGAAVRAERGLARAVDTITRLLDGNRPPTGGT